MEVNEERYVGWTEQQEKDDISKNEKCKWESTKTSYKEGKMGAEEKHYVSNSHHTVYRHVTAGVVLYMPLYSLSTSKEVKRVYRFLFRIQLSNSPNHTDSLPPQVSK